MTKFKFLLFGLLLFLMNCQNDEIVNDFVQPANQNQVGMKISKITNSEIKQNPHILSKISEIKNKIKLAKIGNTQNKIIYYDDYDFFIDTDEATYIESQDGTYHSYTFPIYRNTDNGLIENLVLSFKSEGIYSAYLVTYNLSEDEKLLLINGVELDINDKIDIKSLEYQDWETNDSARVSAECITIHIETERFCDDENGNTIIDNGVLGNGCDSNWVVHTYNVTTIDLDCIGYDSGGSTVNWTPDGAVSTTSNNGNQNGGSSTGYTNPDVTALTFNLAKKQRRIDFLSNQLDSEERDWLLNQDDVQTAVFNYLEDQIYSDDIEFFNTVYPIEDVQFVVNIIAMMMNNQDALNIDFDISVINIINISEYLDCFSNATVNDSFKLTIYVDQPIPNDDATWTNDGTLIDPDINVGHTFISLEMINTSETITQTFGFYPLVGQNVNPISSPSATGAWYDDGGHHFDVSATIEMNFTQFNNLTTHILNYGTPTYNLDSLNCSDAAINICNSAGMGLSDTTGNWVGGSGTNPGNLGQDIRDMSSSSGFTTNTSGGNAQSSEGPCN